MYRISVKKLEDDKVLGLASINVDGKFVFNNIRLMKSSNMESGFYLSMPSYKNKDGEWKSLFNPMTRDMNDVLNKACAKALESNKDVMFGPENIDINIVAKESKLKNVKGDVTMYVGGDFVCDSIHIKENSATKELYVAMPSYKNKDGEYKDYCHPITAEYKTEFDNNALDIYTCVVDMKKEQVEKSMQVVDKPEKTKDKSADTSFVPIADAIYEDAPSMSIDDSPIILR